MFSTTMKEFISIFVVSSNVQDVPKSKKERKRENKINICRSISIRHMCSWHVTFFLRVEKITIFFLLHKDFPNQSVKWFTNVVNSTAMSKVSGKFVSLLRLQFVTSGFTLSLWDNHFENKEIDCWTNMVVNCEGCLLKSVKQSKEIFEDAKFHSKDNLSDEIWKNNTQGCLLVTRIQLNFNCKVSIYMHPKCCMTKFYENLFKFMDFIWNFWFNWDDEFIQITIKFYKEIFKMTT